MVGGAGFEPAASTVWGWHSPAELTARVGYDIPVGLIIQIIWYT